MKRLLGACLKKHGQLFYSVGVGLMDQQLLDTSGDIRLQCVGQVGRGRLGVHARREEELRPLTLTEQHLFFCATVVFFPSGSVGKNFLQKKKKKQTLPLLLSKQASEE